MLVVLAVVSSIDGKLTLGDLPPRFWASDEDQKLFRLWLSEFPVIVMGRKTYEAAKAFIKLSEKNTRIILTRNPEKFKDEKVLGKLEFSSEKAVDLIGRLKRAGIEKVILVTGEEINSDFLDNNLVDELWLTVEPKIFGYGKSMAGELTKTVNLKLVDFQKINKKGTLLLKYEFEKH